MKYHAFLSYSHAADGALAPALQTALHRFAKPWNRMRALRVFRDQTSLAASPELWPALLAELAESEHFLLLASPPAAASRWVQREVDWWLANRSPQKMLVLLTDGMLAWDEAAGDFDWALTDALPDTLRGRFPSEPLWVDLRWARSAGKLDWRTGAFRAAVLDIAAPLHGRSKDELDGEDVRQFARARRLRLSAVTALAVLTAGALAAGGFAWLQRNEAQRNNEIAQAGRLAVHADLRRERRLPADDSALLAAEAVRRLDAIGARSLESDLSLRRALALLPRRLGDFEVGDDDEIALDAAGRHALVRNTAGGGIAVRRLPDGVATGCAGEAIVAQLKAAGLPSHALVSATTADGSHCVTVQIGGGEQRHFDIWSSFPLARIDSVAHASSRGNARPVLADGADLLAITEPGSRGDRIDAAFRIWGRSRQADVLAGPGEFLAFGPGNRVAATSRGIWRLPTGAEPAAAAPLIAFEKPPVGVAFSRDGRFVAVRLTWEGQIALFDLDGAAVEPLRERPAPVGGLLALSDDGRRMVLAHAENALLWDAETEVEQARLPAKPVAAAFGAATVTVLAELDDAANHATRIAVYDMKPAGASQALLPLPAGDEVRWLSVAGERVALLVVEAGGGVRVDRWDAAAGPGSVQTLFRDAGREELLWAASGDGRRIAIARADAVVVVDADQPPGRPKSVPAPGPKNALAFDAAGRRLAVAAADGVTVVEPDSGSRWRWPALAGRIEALRFADDGSRLLALQADHSASRIGPAYRLLRRAVGAPAETPATTPAEVVALGRHGHMPDLGCLVDGDGDGLLLTKRRVRYGDAAASAPAAFEFDRRDCPVARGAALQATIELERELLIADGSGQPRVRLEHVDVIRAAAISADGRRAATADAGGIVQVWPLDAAGLTAQLCARSPRPLSEDAWQRSMPADSAADACGRPRPKGEQGTSN